MLWVYSPWRPSLRVSFRPIAEMFGFGSSILLTNILNTLNAQLLQGVLGHFFPLRQVGYYSQANKWSLLSNGLLAGMVSSVAQPVLAKVGDNAERQTRIFRKMLRFTAFLAFPLLSGLALVAPEFIPLTIGDKWSPCVPYLALLSIAAALSLYYGVAAVGAGLADWAHCWMGGHVPAAGGHCLVTTVLDAVPGHDCAWDAVSRHKGNDGRHVVFCLCCRPGRIGGVGELPVVLR